MSGEKAVRISRPFGLFFLFWVATFLSPSPAAAGVTGSPHDFSGKSFSPGGPCTACHRVHYSPEVRALWSRFLNEEDGYFDQADDPNYIPDLTILCYDCHIDYITAGSGATPDNDPPDSSWNANEEPQDIAFSDGPGGVTGYYELIDGTVPSAGTNDPPTPPLFPPVLEATGGHFWKGVNGDTPTGGYKLGDKLDCSICHDLHDSATGIGVNHNEAMIRVDATDGTDTVYIGEGLNASSPPLTRNGTGTGREICAGCHKYSEDDDPPGTGTGKTLFGVEIPIPPVKPFDGHSNSDTTPCVVCHPHNTPDCGGCHGNPPPVEANGYPGIDETLGPHPKHAFDDGNAGTNEYAFDCMLCHNAWPVDHNSQPTKTWQSVQFDYDDAPAPVKNPSTDINSYAPGTRVCSDLYCHSRGTTINETLNNSGGNTVTWTDANWDTNDLGCEACHGEDAAGGGPRPMGVTVQYGAPGYPNGSPKTNSHDAHPYACSTCHYNVIQESNFGDGWTIYNESLHVNNDTTTFTYNVDPDPASPMFGSYTYAPTGGTCTAIICHGGNPAPWGDDLTCDDCHYNTAGGDVDNWDLTDLVISQIGASEYESTGHGLTSGWFPWPQNYTTSSDSSPIDAPALGCVTTDPTGDTAVGGCHTEKAPHGLLENPFRLATPNNSNFWFEGPGGGISQDSLNEFCWTCHDVNREQTHSQGETSGNNWGTPISAPLHFKCIDCHDPHGDLNDFMIHAAPFADSSRNDAWVNYGLPSTNPADTALPGGGIQAGVGLNVTEPDQQQADYVDLNVGNPSYLCQVCHQSNTYFTRTTTTAVHNAGVDCIHCHPHNKGIQPLCEVCHSKNTIYHPASPQYPGSGDTAPQVMGDGTDPVGTSAPFDDGSWGFNINGHGAAGLSCTPDPVDPVANPGCHDISIPAGTHLDGTLNTYNWPGKPDGDTTNANTSHLMVESAIADGFIDSSAPANDYDVQTFFDDSCAGTNRDPAKSTGCHASDYHRHSDKEAALPNDRMTFGMYGTTADPKQDRAPLVLHDPGDVFLDVAPTANDYWAPWTINDITNAAPVGAAYFGTCVSCHDPHGTNPGYVTDQGITDLFGPLNIPNNMLRHNWKTPHPGYFCVSMCHNPP